MRIALLGFVSVHNTYTQPQSSQTCPLHEAFSASGGRYSAGDMACKTSLESVYYLQLDRYVYSKALLTVDSLYSTVSLRLCQ